MPRLSPAITLVLLLATPGLAHAGDVIVSVSGANGSGDIACALFANATGFPLHASEAAAKFRAPAHAGQACRFHSVAPGTYAVAASNLAKNLNNVELDYLGRPEQPWGVSNNARPALRAPTFSEAAFKVAEKGETRISIHLAK